MTCSPPLASTSTMEYSPKGRMFTSTGRRRARSLNSSWLRTSPHRSMPAARAISTLCNTTLVEPPMAIATARALRSAAGVTMSRGRIPRLVIVIRQSTTCSGNSLSRRGSSDAGETMCKGSRPATAMKVCIVL